MSYSEQDNLTNEVGRIHARYNKTSEHRRVVVFCANCGSTNLDQNSISEIRCYDCNNKTSWNGYQFSVIATDSRDSFDNRDDQVMLWERQVLSVSGFEGSWAEYIDEEMKQFRDIVLGGFSRIHYRNDVLVEVQSEWEKMKNSIDTFLAAMNKG